MFNRMGRPGALVIGLLLLAVAVGRLPAGEGGAAAENTVRIGVVRLQEIVERYQRYIYVTARFTEDYRVKYNQQVKELDAITAELDAQKNTTQNMLEMLVKAESFEAYLESSAKLQKRHMDALLKLRDLAQLKEDLNTAMSLTTMEDIADAVKTIAASQQFDYVTDYFPADTAQQHLSGTDKALEQSGNLMLENLQNRAPTLYADPALDVTERVVKYLNDKYSDKYGADKGADPLLTEPLEQITAALKARQDAFKAAQAARVFPPLAAPIGEGYAYGVVNLQQVIMSMTVLRRFDVQFEELESRLKDLQAEVGIIKRQVTDMQGEVKAKLENGEAVGADVLASLNEFQASLDRKNRDFLNLQMKAMAINATTSNRLFEEISAETRLQAQARGIQLVVATFSNEKARRAETVERALANKNMVVWHRNQASLDLTAPVLKALTEKYQQHQAELAKNGQKENEFGLPKPADQVLVDYIAQMKASRQQQVDDDKRRFDQWHAYQKDVLKIEPTKPPVDETKDAVGSQGAGGAGGAGAAQPKIVQPDPTPVAPASETAP